MRISQVWRRGEMESIEGWFDFEERKKKGGESDDGEKSERKPGRV